MPAVLTADFFHTRFFSEVMVDREVPTEVHFYSVENGTRANSFQVQLDLTPARRTDIRMAYRMFDVESPYRKLGYLQKPFISKHRGFLSATQTTRSGWQFHAIASFLGPQRLPGKPIHSSYSPGFPLLNAQVSKTMKKAFEVFIGGENILDYRQEDPIRAANEPFSPMFDAGLIWGPVFGRMFYGGFRWRM